MRITPKQYAQTLYDLIDGESESEIKKSVADFARHIYKERKLKMADKIASQFSKIYNQKKGIIEVEIITRKKIDDVGEKRAKHFVKEKYHAKEVILKNTIDESVKGGMILKVGDEIVDGSIAGKLGELKKILAN